MATLRPKAFQHVVDDLSAGSRPPQQPFTRVVDDLAAAGRNAAPTPPPPPSSATAGVDPRVVEGLRARAAAARTAAAATGGGAGAPPPLPPPAASSPSAGSGRLRGLGQAIGKQMQRPGVAAAGRLGSAGLAVHHGAQAIDGFQNAETGADRFAAGYQALRSAAAAGAAAGNPVAGAFTGASVAGDIIGNALPQRAQDFIGAGVNDIVTGAGALLGRDWNAVPRGTPAQPPQLRANVASPTAVPAGANAAAPTAVPAGANAAAPTAVPAGANAAAPMAVPAGANVPTPPPGFEGMQMGRIYRDGNSFSGWGDPNAQANTRTLLTTAAQTGNMQGLTPLQQRQAQMLRDGGTIDSHGNIMTRDVRESLARTAPGQSGPQHAQQTPVQEAMDAVAQMRARGLRVTGQTFRSMVNDITARRASEVSAATALRGQDLDATTAQRGQDVNAQTLRRGQDFDAQERQFQREATLRQRQMLAQIMERAEGDPRRAAAIAASAGLSPKEFLDMAENAQQFSARSAESAEKRIEELMVADAEGRIPDAERARVRAMVSRMAPGFFNMSEADQLHVLPDVTAGVNLLRGANELRNHGLLQMIGWDGSSPEITMLPENLRGAQLGEVTLAEGAFTPGGVRREDYRLRLPDGQVMFIPRGRMDQTMQDFLSRQGVDVGALPR